MIYNYVTNGIFLILIFVERTYYQQSSSINMIVSIYLMNYSKNTVYIDGGWARSSCVHSNWFIVPLFGNADDELKNNSVQF